MKNVFSELLELHSTANSYVVTINLSLNSALKMHKITLSCWRAIATLSKETSKPSAALVDPWSSSLHLKTANRSKRWSKYLKSWDTKSIYPSSSSGNLMFRPMERSFRESCNMKKSKAEHQFKHPTSDSIPTDRSKHIDWRLVSSQSKVKMNSCIVFMST